MRPLILSVFAVFASACGQDSVDVTGDAHPGGGYALNVRPLTLRCDGKEETLNDGIEPGQLYVQADDRLAGAKILDVFLERSKWRFQFPGVTVAADGTFEAWAQYPSAKAPLLGFHYLRGEFSIRDHRWKDVNAEMALYDFHDDGSPYSSASPSCRFTLQLSSE